jgi:hypothetical protein
MKERPKAGVIVVPLVGEIPLKPPLGCLGVDAGGGGKRCRDLVQHLAWFTERHSQHGVNDKQELVSGINLKTANSASSEKL